MAERTSDHDRLEQLGALIEAQRAIVDRLYGEWASAIRVMNTWEREQSQIFRKRMDRPPSKGDGGK